jgi:hypothetical protein
LTGVAGAAGNTTVAGYLVSNPIAGWSPWPSGSANAASSLQATLNADDPGVAVAAAGWMSGVDRLLVILVAFTRPTAYDASLEVDRGCQKVVQSNAVAILPIPGVPGSEDGVCARTLDGLTVVQADWAVGNTVAVVTGIGLSRAVVNRVSRRQEALIPSTGIPLQPATTPTIGTATVPVTTAPPASTNSSSSGVPAWALFGGGALIVVLAAALVIVVVRSRKQRSGA